MHVSTLSSQISTGLFELTGLHKARAFDSSLGHLGKGSSVTSGNEISPFKLVFFHMKNGNNSLFWLTEL